MDHLQVGGEVGQRAEHEDADAEAGDGGQHEVAVGEQPHRHQRVLRAQLDEDEERADDDEGHDQPDDHRIRPLVLVAAPGGHEHQGRGGDRHGRGARPVEVEAALALGQAQQEGDRRDRDQTQRDVEPQAPAPAGAVGEPAAEHRAEHRGDGEGRAHDAHVLAALARGGHLGRDGLREDHHAAAGDALQHAGDDEHGHRVGEPAEQGTEDEQGVGEDEQALAPDLVAELAEDRQRDGLAEQEAGDHPAHVLHAAELADDGRQGGGEDHLAQRAHQHGEHQRGDDPGQQAAGLGGDAGGVRGLGGGGRGGGGVGHAVAGVVLGDGRGIGWVSGAHRWPPFGSRGKCSGCSVWPGRARRRGRGAARDAAGCAAPRGRWA